MSFLSKLYFGYFASYRSPWPGFHSALPIPENLAETFAAEGIYVRSSCFESHRVRLVVKTDDSVTPVFLTQRLKGRLSYSLGKSHPEFPGFSCQFFLRTLGQNTRDVVSSYIQRQVDRSDLADPLYREKMKELRFQSTEDMQSLHTKHRGIYDLFAHVILVTGGRYQMTAGEAKTVFEALCEGAAHLTAEPVDISMMPDHAHLFLRWPQPMSATDLLEGIKKESGALMRRSAFWNEGGYVGTVGPYSIKVALQRNREAGGWKSVPRSR